MIKLDEARKITRKVMEDKAKKRQEEVAKFCETIVSEAIREKANEGNRSVIIECEHEFRDEVMKYIESNGQFDIIFAFGNNYIDIHW